MCSRAGPSKECAPTYRQLPHQAGRYLISFSILSFALDEGPVLALIARRTDALLWEQTVTLQCLPCPCWASCVHRSFRKRSRTAKGMVPVSSVAADWPDDLFGTLPARGDPGVHLQPLGTQQQRRAQAYNQQRVRCLTFVRGCDCHVLISCARVQRLPRGANALREI